MMDAFEKLANAIILQAVKDYRFALKRIANTLAMILLDIRNVRLSISFIPGISLP